jgi:hypothetical protein
MINSREKQIMESIGNAQPHIFNLRQQVQQWYSGNPEYSNDIAVKEILKHLDIILSEMELDKYFESMKKLD